MRRLRLALLAAPLLAAFAAPAPVVAQAWPDRPVTIISNFGPGSSQDVLARLLAPKLQAAWGQPVVVNNVVGAAGTIGVERGARATDGHTIVLSGDAAIVVRVSMPPRLPYDPLRDLSPITLLGRTPNVLVVGNSVPVQTLAELVAMARNRPGSVTFAHAGPGTSQHIGGEMLAQMAGLEMTAVAYNEPASQIQDVLTGRVTFSFNSGVVALPRLADGSWRALAVSSPARMLAAPNLPTVAELGYPGFDATAWLGLFAPAAMPPANIAIIHRAAVAALAEADVRARLETLGVEIVGSSPAELRALIEREIPRMAGVLSRAGIRPE